MSGLANYADNTEVEAKVKAVVQVAGLHSLVRPDPHNESRRDWFRQVSPEAGTQFRATANTQSNRIYVPSSHPMLADERVKRRLGGQIFTSGQSRLSIVSSLLICRKRQGGRCAQRRSSSNQDICGVKVASCTGCCAGQLCACDQRRWPATIGRRPPR